MDVKTRPTGAALQALLTTAAQALPPLSASVVELTSVCVAPDWNIEDASAVIDRDPMLLGALAREANSVAFASTSMVDSSRDVVVRLGAARIMSMAIEMGLERLLGSIKEYGPDAVAVFDHCVISAVAAETVRAKAKVRIPQALAASALLHDIGEIVLARYLALTNGPTLAEIRSTGLRDIDAESDTLGLDHSDVSAIICSQWTMPDSIVQAVHHHHTPWMLDSPTAYGVALADQIATCIESPDQHDATADSLIFGRCLDELGCESCTLNELVDATTLKLEKRKP